MERKSKATDSKLSKFRTNNNSKKLFSKMKKMGKKSFSNDTNDDRFWKPKKNSNGNIVATIRFLPDATMEGDNYFMINNEHFFKQKNGKWYVENCGRDEGIECPACNDNHHIYNNQEEYKELEAIYSNRAKRKNYIANVLVIKDVAEPENEGKVFLYKMPFTIFKMILAMGDPEFEGDEEIDVFNPLTGCNLEMKLPVEMKSFGSKKVEVPDYKSAKFKDSTPLSDNEDKIDIILGKVYNLVDLKKEDKYKLKETSELLDKYEPFDFEGMGITIKDDYRNVEKNSESVDEIENISKATTKDKSKKAGYDMEDEIDEEEEDIDIDDIEEEDEEPVIEKKSTKKIAKEVEEDDDIDIDDLDTDDLFGDD